MGDKRPLAGVAGTELINDCISARLRMFAGAEAIRSVRNSVIVAVFAKICSGSKLPLIL